MQKTLIFVAIITSVALCDDPLTFYSGRMSFTSMLSSGIHTLRRIANPQTLLTLCELTYNDYFGLELTPQLKPSSHDRMLFSLSANITARTNNLPTFKITVMYAILTDLPFLEIFSVNLTAAQRTRILTSRHGISYDETVSVAAFPVGFRHLNLTTEVFFTATEGFDNYTVFSNSTFGEYDWVLLNVVVVDESPRKEVMQQGVCGGDFIAPVYKATNRTGPYSFQYYTGMEYLFGIQAAYLNVGQLTFDHDTRSMIVNGRGLFDASCIFLNLSCNLQPTPSSPSKTSQKTSQPVTSSTTTTSNSDRSSVLLVLTIVFATLFGLLLLLIIGYFVLCFKRHVQFIIQSGSSSQGAIPVVESKLRSSQVTPQKKFQKQLQQNPPEDLLSDTRLTSAPRRRAYYRSRVLNTAQRGICEHPACVNNPNGVNGERKLCLRCTGVEEIV